MKRINWRIVGAAALAAALAVGMALSTGCAQGRNDMPKATMPAAMGDDLGTASQAATDHASDAKLVAMKLTNAISDDASARWEYYFVSHLKVGAYTVTVKDGQASLTRTGKAGYTIDDMDAIPTLDDTCIDADAAYVQVIGRLKSGQIAENCNCYLMTYVKGDSDPTADALKWFFVFNGADGSQNDPFAYDVDVTTGEVEDAQIVTEQSDSESTTAATDPNSASVSSDMSTMMSMMGSAQ